MNFFLSLHKLYSAFLKKSRIINNQKSYSYWLSKKYENEPLISFIIQSHNKSLQVLHIVEKLRNYSNKEIIVIDDGSSLSHTSRILKYLNGSNEFLIRSNDLYENVMYDRAIRMANGKYLALLQDDDDFENLAWVDKAIALLNRNSDMVVLGGNNMRSVVFDNEKKIVYSSDYKHSGQFCYAPVVDRAPMWINKELFTKYIHHIDFRFAPFQYDDFEMCLRAWTNGASVGWYNAGFTSLSAGGMRIWNGKFIEEQMIRNGSLLYNDYKDRVQNIINIVDSKNGTNNENSIN